MVSEYLRSGRPAGRCCAPKFLYCTAVDKPKNSSSCHQNLVGSSEAHTHARTADATPMLRCATRALPRANGWCYSMRAVASRGMVDVALARRKPGEAVESGPTTDAALLSIEGGVATITLNQPDNKNALSVDLMNALGDHLLTAEADDAVRVCVRCTIFFFMRLSPLSGRYSITHCLGTCIMQVVLLTNAGNTFCAGADLKGKSENKPRHSLVDVMSAIIDCPKPVIGRIAGHCTGGGVGLASACDISIVPDNALFGFTEVRLGVCPAVISVVCLPKLRRADASELFLSGERVTARLARSSRIEPGALAPLNPTLFLVTGSLQRACSARVFCNVLPLYPPLPDVPRVHLSLLLPAGLLRWVWSTTQCPPSRSMQRSTRWWARWCVAGQTRWPQPSS